MGDQSFTASEGVAFLKKLTTNNNYCNASVPLFDFIHQKKHKQTKPEMKAKYC